MQKSGAEEAAIGFYTALQGISGFAEPSVKRVPVTLRISPLSALSLCRWAWFLFAYSGVNQEGHWTNPL